MHGEIIDTTIGALAARAARYPVIVKGSRPRTVMKRAIPEPAEADPGIRWLLLNTQRINRLMGTGRQGIAATGS